MKQSAIILTCLSLFGWSLVAFSNESGLGPGAEIYSIDELDSPPKPIKNSRVAPIYPPHLKRERFMGVVNVELVVDEAGDVISLTALTSAHPDFTKAVLVAIPEWKFEPGIKDGEPVKSIVQLPMTFMLRAKKGVQEVTPENPLHPGSGGIPLENGAEIMKQQKEMISGSKN